MRKLNPENAVSHLVTEKNGNGLGAILFLISSKFSARWKLLQHKLLVLLGTYQVKCCFFAPEGTFCPELLKFLLYDTRVLSLNLSN